MASPGRAVPRILIPRIAVSLSPANGGICGSLCATVPASCAAASTSSTPGNSGWPGKWPRRKGSSPRTRYSPAPLLPGSSLSRRLTNRNSGPCGRKSSASFISVRMDCCSFLPEGSELIPLLDVLLDDGLEGGHDLLRELLTGIRIAQRGAVVGNFRQNM